MRWFVHSKPVLIVHCLDPLLDKLKRGEEDGVYDAGSAHRDPETSIHVTLEELNLRRGFDCLSF
jgi:hypothetical protein